MFTKLRRPALLGAVLVSVASLAAACGSSGSAATSSSSTPSTAASGGGATTTASSSSLTSFPANTPKHLTIGLISTNIASSGILLYKQALVPEAQKLGWTVKAVDTNGNTVNAVSQVEQWIQQKAVQVIVDDTIDNSTMVAAIKAAKAANIPWFSVSSGWVPGVTNEVETNEVANGANLAQALAEKLGGKGNILQFDWKALPAVAQQDVGVKAVLGEYPGIHVQDIIQLKVPGWAQDAYQQTTDYLKAHTNINAIIIPWDDFASNVVQAVKQAGMANKIVVAGFDMDPGAARLIRDNSPYKLAEALNIPAFAISTVHSIAEYETGHAVPPVSDVPTCLATPSNAPASGGISNKAFWKSCYSEPLAYEG